MITNLKLPADVQGAIRYGMTNDYMFRAVLQSNNKVLRGLICSLLHLNDDEVISVVITNPIVLGDTIQDKECRLDINILLNDNTLINLEMQVANRLNWHERSVTYLCRSFDSLDHGQDYNVAKPAVHIGFLDYTLFPERPKFYDTYKLLSIHDHEKYSDSLTLCVIDLSRIELATETDRTYHINDWANCRVREANLEKIIPKGFSSLQSFNMGGDQNERIHKRIFTGSRKYPLCPEC